MGRATLAVIAGAVVWAVLWVGGAMGAQAALPDLLDPTQRLEHVPALLGYIAYSVVLSVLAGFVTAAARGPSPMRAVWVLAWIQLALGVAIEASAWAVTPVWYHLVFLALLVPATVWGGTLRAASPSAV